MQKFFIFSFFFALYLSYSNSLPPTKKTPFNKFNVSILLMFCYNKQKVSIEKVSLEKNKIKNKNEENIYNRKLWSLASSLDQLSFESDIEHQQYLSYKWKLNFVDFDDINHTSDICCIIDEINRICDHRSNCGLSLVRDILAIFKVWIQIWKMV